ncbi:hypothetical protein PUMCH_004463 [Australozyma saopauloensis]|uniref:Uncharacterized protein n=1 Tax=Australozyma saopauloensis TaxID=291208 RepID=A0AAX4HH77_9ASCO|nr:hypothetical protein PUMCH_004463 [[Candida] saopauloensis]
MPIMTDCNVYLMAGGMLHILFVCLDEIGLELLELCSDNWNKQLLNVRCILRGDHKHILILILIVEKLVDRYRGANILFLVLLGSTNREQKLHVVNAQRLALSLGDITVSRDRVDTVDDKCEHFILEFCVEKVLIHVVLTPWETVLIDPVPEQSVLVGVKKNQKI